MSQTCVIAPAFAGILERSGLSGPEALFNWSQGERLDKRSLEPWRQRWRLKLSDTGGQQKTFYLKRFKDPPMRRQWARWLAGHSRRSTAAVEWENCRALSLAGIPAVEPVALAEEMRGPLERRSAIMLAEVPGESLERWTPANLPPCSARLTAETGMLRELIDALARLVADFHRAGFVHRDLYLAHIFIDGLPRSAEPGKRGQAPREITLSMAGGRSASEPVPFCRPVVFRLIDLQRVFRPRWRRRRWAVKDLAALSFSASEERVSRRDRLRFLARYVRQCPDFGPARSLAGLIDRKVHRMARHHRKTLESAAPTGASH